MTDNETQARIEGNRRLASAGVFEVVRRDGEEELARPTASLFWSGLAAGIAMGFSVVAEAAILAALPDAPWAKLIGDMGYTVGFLLVVLGGLQLFTETTITPVIPLCHTPSRARFVALGRLWAVVLAANLVGAALVAGFLMTTGALKPEIRVEVLALGRHVADGGFWETVALGVPAGFLIAAMVWSLASAPGRPPLVIFAITYVIAVAGFAHVIAGSVEMTALYIEGLIGLGEAVVGFLVPALIGNVIGGTALFTLIAYAQIRREVGN